MLEKQLVFVKAHPYATGFGVFFIGALLVYVMLGKRGGSAQQAPVQAAPIMVGSTGPNAATVQAGTALALAQMKSNNDAAQLNAATAAQTAQLTATRDTSMKYLDVMQALGLERLSTDRQIALSGNEVQKQKDAYAFNLGIATLGSNERITANAQALDWARVGSNERIAADAHAVDLQKYLSDARLQADRQAIGFALGKVV